jgi:hypothetical protein
MEIKKKGRCCVILVVTETVSQTPIILMTYFLILNLKYICD